MQPIYVTMIPPSRISSNAQTEIRVISGNAESLTIHVKKKDTIVRIIEYPLDNQNTELKIYPDLSEIKGSIVLEMNFHEPGGNCIKKLNYDYEIIDTVCKSTTLIDGCWVSIYHWSESEGRWFNSDLGKLTDQDWKEQIYAMHRVGINGIIIQNVFASDKYAGNHKMMMKDYDGKAFYPSRVYKDRFPITAEDPIEAILSAADEVNMNVFVGVGLFAWFDFSDVSLEWHKKITEELYHYYGHHPSLYGWYISEEIHGSLYFENPNVKDEGYKDIVNFFNEYKAFVQKLTPTKPVALAPNNIRFHEFANEWKKILINVDILIPFAFARDPEHINIDEINSICKACGTHFWVDMEMFAWPLDNGLVPKTYDELIKEIRTYDKLEQIYGYQFTGIMNSPECTYNLGGQNTKKLYEDYHEYYKRTRNIKPEITE